MDAIKHNKGEKKNSGSEGKLLLLLESLREGAVVISKKGDFIYANESAARNLGYTRKEFLKLKISDIEAKETEKEFEKHFSDMLEGKRLKFETLHRKKDGSLMDVDVTLNVVDYKKEEISLSIWHDITEDKRAEKALEESEKKFKIHAERSSNMIFIFKKGRTVYVNRKNTETMGYTREEYYSPELDFRKLIAPDYLRLCERIAEKHAKGEEVLPYEYALINKRGERIEVFTTTKNIDYEGERAVFGVMFDITEQNKIERLLEGVKKHFEKFFEN